MRRFVGAIEANKRILQIGALAIMILTVAYASALSFWTESEVWSSVVVKYLFQDHEGYAFSVKPLTNFMLWLSYFIAKDLGRHPMDVDRAVFALNLIVLLSLFLYLVREKLFAWHTPTWLAILLVLGNSFLIKRGAQVRSDLIVTTLVLAWLVFWEHQVKSNKPKWIQYSTILLVTVVSVLFTPKAILTWGVIALSLVSDRRKQWTILASGLVGLAFVVSHPDWFSYLPALHFYLTTFQSGVGLPAYMSLSRFDFLIHFLQENPLMLIIWLRNLTMGLSARTSRSALSQLHLDIANYSLIMMILTPEKLPFFIASLVPLWALPVSQIDQDPWWLDLRDKIRPRLQLVFKTSIFVILLVGGGGWSTYLIWNHNSDAQHRFCDFLKPYYSQLSQLEVYDPAGTVPFLNAHHWFVGPAESNNEKVIQRLKANPPDVILSSRKLFLLGEELKEFLNHNYSSDGAGIYIRLNRLRMQSPARLTASRLFEKVGPYILDNDHNQLKTFELIMRAENNLNLSRFASWEQEDRTFAFNEVVDSSQVQDWILNVPEGVTYFDILPIHIQTPFDQDWYDIFRFDPEN